MERSQWNRPTILQQHVNIDFQLCYSGPVFDSNFYLNPFAPFNSSIINCYNQKIIPLCFRFQNPFCTNTNSYVSLFFQLFILTMRANGSTITTKYFCIQRLHSLHTLPQLFINNFQIDTISIFIPNRGSGIFFFRAYFRIIGNFTFTFQSFCYMIMMTMKIGSIPHDKSEKSFFFHF